MSNSESNYTATEEQINQLQKQINISKANAIKLIIANKGDMVKCILASYDFQEEPDTKMEKLDPDDPSRKCYELRQIMDEKDTIFTAMMDNKK